MADLIGIVVRERQVWSLVLSITLLIWASHVTSPSLGFPNEENKNIYLIELSTGSVSQSGVPLN